MKVVSTICESNSESLSSVLWQCCVLTGEAGCKAHKVILHCFDAVRKGKGIEVSFSKLLSVEAWNDRLKLMRVPDWYYLLFKLKSRISDSAWQDLVNLTKLRRTGISK